MNLMKLEGYKAAVSYDEELDTFRGKILGLSGGADFYGDTPAKLKAEFKKSLDEYLEVCKEEGINPHRTYSGKFNLRMPPALHEELAKKAESLNKSLNALAIDALENLVSH